MSDKTKRLFDALYTNGKHFEQNFFKITVRHVIARMGELIPESELAKFTDEELRTIMSETFNTLTSELDVNATLDKAIFESETYLNKIKSPTLPLKSYAVYLDTGFTVNTNDINEIDALATNKLKEMLNNNAGLEFTYEELED